MRVCVEEHGPKCDFHFGLSSSEDGCFDAEKLAAGELNVIASNDCSFKVPLDAYTPKQIQEIIKKYSPNRLLKLPLAAAIALS